MGDAQSAQREEKGKKDAAAEEESRKVGDAQTEQNIEDKPLKNSGQISEINGKADDSIAEVNSHCEDEIAAEAILLSDGDVSETEKPLKEDKTPLENMEINEKQSPNEADANEDVPLEMIEIDAKQNDINESFRRFFSNIGLKLTVKKGSGEIPTDVREESNQEKPNRPQDIQDTAKETKSENTEQNTDVNIAQDTYDNDSTTCPTLTDITLENVLENAEERTTETKEKMESDNADAATTSPVGEDAHQDATPEEEPHSTSPSSPEEEVVVSSIKRFFTTGIFSGLRKKKKPAEEETTEKEQDTEEKEVVETTEQTVQDQQHDKEEIGQVVEAAAVETEHKENEEVLFAASTQMTDEGKSPTTDPSTIIVTEPEILSSQEKDKVHASPLKRLLSGSSLKKLSKKQRSRKSSDAKLSDSAEHVSDQLLSSTESAENQKEGPTQPTAEAAGEEDGAWASFKKLVTPKKRMKRSSLSNEETQIPGSVEETKPSEGEQISDHSTEEGKKRKDSSVSWEAVLCGSGRRRSRKTSDSEDETPQIDNGDNKQDGGSKHGAESLLESSNENENEILVSSPKHAGSPSEGDGGSTWKSFKRLVTPKRKVKDEDESKDNVQSDSEVTQDESFSIKKLLPGLKKRKSAEKQDQVSSDEAVASGDEDSDTPAVVPLCEFDTVETEVHIQIQADVESHIPEEADYELQQDILDQVSEPVLPCDSLQTETKKVQDNDDALGKQASTSLATNEEPDDLTESISSHQQLSDIPEEGIITETMATPASVTEEAARDDTIAEDLIEITSEAITAPEPALDITLADETEMISAVSQLSSESSKTSGNTTPVPAEYDVIETDVLLQQVVETISISPKAVPVCSDELSSERIVDSVSYQIFETFVKEPTFLEIHRRLDASAINTGLNVEELDAINENAATAQTESISEVNDSVSTEIVSEVPTEEFDTAEIALDELHEVNFTHPEESIKELESIDESYYLVECLSEVNAAVSTDILHEDEEMVPDEGSLVEAHQAETEPAKIDSQEAGSAATVADETKDGAMEQEVQTLTEVEDQIMHKITDQIQPPVEVEDWQELAAVQAAMLDSEERSVQLLDKEVISKDIPVAETVTYELKEETVPLNEVNVDPEKEDELETDAAKTDHVQVTEALEGSVQLPEETVTDELKQTAEHLTEVSAEPENKELLVNAVKTEHVQEPEVLEAVQAPTLDSEDGIAQSLEKKLISEDVPETETVTDEPKEETVPLNEVNLEPVDASNTEHVQEPEVLEAVQAPTLESEDGSVQSLEKKVISEDVPKAETVTDEPKEETVPLNEVNLEPVDASNTEHVQEPEVLEAVQAPTLDSEDGSVQLLEKKAISEDVPKAETVTDEPKEETVPLNEVNLEPVDASNTDHVQEPEVLETVQAPTLDSEDGSVKSLEKNVISLDVPEAETVTDEPTEETLPQIEVNLEPVDASNTEHVQEPEVLEAVQTATLDLLSGSLPSLENEVMSEDIPPAETVTDEPKQTAEHLTEVSVELETKELPENAVKTEHVQEPEVLEAVQAPTLDSEDGSVQSLEKKIISENVPEAETVHQTDEPKEETIPVIEVNIEPVDASNIEHVQEPEVLQAVSATSDLEAGSLLSLEKEVISEHIPAVETVTDEPKQEIEVRVEPEEKLPVEAAKTKHVQEPEVLPSDVKDIVTETKTEEGALMYVHVVTESTEGGSAEELQKQILLEDVPKPDADNVITSVTDEIESEVVAQLDQALEIAGDQKTEIMPKDVEQEDCIPEVVDELQTLTAFHVSSINEEASNVQVLEKTVISEETPAPCVDTAAVTDEPKHEVHLSAVQVSVEGEKEKELPSTEIKTAAFEHAVVAQVVTCNLKEVSVAIPDVLIEKTSDITEPLIDRVASELLFKEEVESATPLVKDDVAETAEEGSVVVMMHVPSVKFEDNHRIQMQVVDVDIKSAETIVDTVLEAGVKEAKKVIDVCHEMVKKVDNLSATPEIEEELINEENKVTIQQVIQHIKENLPETIPESVVINLEQELIKQSDAVTEVSELVESETNEVKDQEAMEDSSGIFRGRQDEAPTVISDDSVSEDLMQTPDIPGSLDVSIYDNKEDLEETKAEQEKSEAGVTIEEVKSSLEELDVNKNYEQAQSPQIAQSPIVKPTNTGLVVPQNTGIISSIGNVESPSSLSLEFKLNIQFGQAKAQASPLPTTERIEPVKQTDMPEVGVQAVQPVKPINPTERAESQKQKELTEVAVQVTEITEPAANLDSTERVVFTTQPVLLDISSQVMEKIEPVEEIKSTERATSSVQATETIQPVRQTEKRAVFLSQPVLSEVCNQETKAEELVKQIEEENDQDVWVDAEEVIYTQKETEVSLLEVEESLEPPAERNQEEKAGFEHEVEVASKTKEEGSQQEMHKTGGMCEIESEGEDFAVALEHPETATASPLQWD
ncbi:A-kinase anchor protein 12 [Siniperca chuatsi]|uniref:A-kinase anchor protein 12 n=1 Tax=Siniperca chuatsi TaxID=119488 RepID=UPI001CE10A46|nr:A-kinase anchor protein 12 [Siniperca chuatsi]